MKKFRIWRAADDERLLSESGRIYRVGFWVLAAGILLDVLIKLARFYNTSVDYLLGLTDEMTPYPRRRG